MFYRCCAGVLEVIPKSMFVTLHEIIDLLTSKMVEVWLAMCCCCIALWHCCIAAAPIRFCCTDTHDAATTTTTVTPVPFVLRLLFAGYYRYRCYDYYRYRCYDCHHYRTSLYEYHHSPPGPDSC
jgi:hypothetical protein